MSFPNRKRKEYAINNRDLIKVGKEVYQSNSGKNIIYEVSAGEMYKDGFLFYQSVNGVWLTDRVPAKYLSIYNE